MISVVIPVLNEGEIISTCVENLLPWGDHLEIIFSDGGSDDHTIETIKKFPVKLVQTTAGRGNQMNAGAAIATGEILLFLHSDTQLPDSFIDDIHTILQQPKVIAGAFPLHIDGPDPSLRWLETLVLWRSRLFSLPYGDQAIFLKTDTFRAMGGYRPLPIMEDYELIQRLKPQGKIALTPNPVTTSPRRWQKLGIWRTTLINQLMIVGYHLKLKPERLRRWYRGQKA